MSAPEALTNSQAARSLPFSSSAAGAARGTTRLAARAKSLGDMGANVIRRPEVARQNGEATGRARHSTESSPVRYCWAMLTPLRTLLSFGFCFAGSFAAESFDLVVYGGTSAAVTA